MSVLTPQKPCTSCERVFSSFALTRGYCRRCHEHNEERARLARERVRRALNRLMRPVTKNKRKQA